MTEVFCHSDDLHLKSSKANIRVRLFDVAQPGEASVGNRVRAELARLDATVSQAAFDFLAIALSVASADRFVLRSDAPDGFGRNIKLVIGLADPARWTPAKPKMEEALSFLSGDKWELEFLPGGHSAPVLAERNRKKKTQLSVENLDEVCLFSGGMDSLIGAIDRISEGRRPLLVSRSTRGDSQHQEYLRLRLGGVPNLSINDDIRGPFSGEPSTRSRSMVFLALAACGASAISNVHGAPSVSLIIPENGFIALNPPLSTRRIGALSTRTVHPHFIGTLQEVFDLVGIPARIENPFYFLTKGEALTACRDQDLLKRTISHTVSCGKWKRYWQQCGRCLPCLIRRAAFHAAGLPDDTATSSRKGYRFDDLSVALAGAADRADIRAVAIAIQRARVRDIRSWLIESGPLPMDTTVRGGHMEVAERGLAEIEQFLRFKGIKA